MRILFVENHEEFARTVMKQFLAEHEVIVAKTLADARAELAGAKFDTILVDYDLDDGKGVELVTELRANGNRGRIIAVSAHFEGNYALQLAGANAACPKLEFARIAEVLQPGVWERFHGNPPARPEAIRQAQGDSGIRFPEGYVAFLEKMNGGGGFIRGSYVNLYRVEELLETNKGYDVGKYVPGLFLFGSNGGGEGFFFDLRAVGGRIVRVPFIPMELKEARPMGATFEAFLNAL